MYTMIMKGLDDPEEVLPYLIEKISAPVLLPHVESIYQESKLNQYIHQNESVELLWNSKPKNIEYSFLEDNGKIKEKIMDELNLNLNSDNNKYTYQPPARFVCNHKDVIIDDVNSKRIVYLNENKKAFGPFNFSSNKLNKKKILKKARKSHTIQKYSRLNIFQKHDELTPSNHCNSRIEVGVSLLEKGDTYGHFLITHLPKIHRARIYKRMTGVSPVFLLREGHNWQKEIMYNFGFDDDDLVSVSKSDFPIYVDNFVFTDQKYIGVERFQFCKEDLNWIRKTLQKNILSENTNSPDRLFVSRQNYDRCVENIGQLQEVLDFYEIHTYRPEELSFREQYNLFSNANLLIGVAGSNLANAIFSSDINIIGLHPENKLNVPWPAISLCLNQNWNPLVCSNDESNKDNITVNVRRLKSTLDAMALSS